jgi:hypothetical protein
MQINMQVEVGNMAIGVAVATSLLSQRLDEFFFALQYEILLCLEKRKPPFSNG